MTRYDPANGKPLKLVEQGDLLIDTGEELYETSDGRILSESKTDRVPNLTIVFKMVHDLRERQILLWEIIEQMIEDDIWGKHTQWLHDINKYVNREWMTAGKILTELKFFGRRGSC